MAKRVHNGAIFFAGDRLEIHPATDTWMSGDRYGEVIKTTAGGKWVHIKMDRSGKVLKRHSSLFATIGSRVLK